MSVAWHKKTHGVLTRREELNPMTVRLFALGGGIIAILMALYLALSASTIRLSVQLWSLHNDMAAIQRQNSYLETEIARHGSIPVLQVRSAELGYQAADGVEYLTTGAR